MPTSSIEIDYLKCPFSGKDLRFLSKQELAVINQKIEAGELYFYPGAPVEVKLKKALVSGHQTYIYPVIDDILFLKKETAIIPKNRTENPLLRTSQQAVDRFYGTYKLRRKDKAKSDSVKDLQSNPLSNEQLLELKNLLPKDGQCFLSAVTHDTDAIHNLIFGTDFQHHLHIDTSLDRLRAVKPELNKETVLILCDNLNMPFKENQVNAVFSFDYINSYEKKEQSVAYEELKRVLEPTGVSVVLYHKEKPLHAQSNLKSDQLSKKALGVLAPWKKVKVPTIHFHPVQSGEPGEQNRNWIPKTSLGGQLL